MKWKWCASADKLWDFKSAGNLLSKHKHKTSRRYMPLERGAHPARTRHKRQLCARVVTMAAH